MSNATRLLLRLPPGLRQHILEPSRSALRFRVTAQRTYAQKGRHLPPPPKPYGLSQAAVEVPAANKKPSPPEPAKFGKPPPIVIPGEKQMRDAKQNVVLLYTAPSHGVFYVVSYLAGGLFIIGAYSYSELILKDSPDGSKPPWWKKAIGAISALAAASFGTMFLLGPFGLIKSIAIVTAEANIANATSKYTRGPRSLRIEVKRKLPFLKPDILETNITNVALDRRVPIALQDLKFHSIPMASSESWTADYFKGAAEPTRSSGVTAAVKGIWPATIREVRRMFLRDQIARVKVKGNGSFKLDLQGCRMLEGGQALDRVLAEDILLQKSPVLWLMDLLRG